MKHTCNYELNNFKPVIDFGKETTFLSLIYPENPTGALDLELDGMLGLSSKENHM